MYVIAYIPRWKRGNDFQIRSLLTVYIAKGAKMVQSVMYGPRIDLQISK